MKPLLLSCIVLLAIGCKKSHNITIADLKFADYEKEFIAKNGVDTTYEFYTFGSDTNVLGSITNYDTLGRTARQKIVCFMPPTYTYTYDSLGLVIKLRTVSDFGMTDLFTYRFKPDSFKLERFSNNGREAFQVFYFDSIYREIKRVTKAPPVQYETTFEYGANNKIHIINSAIVGKPKDIMKHRMNVSITSTLPYIHFKEGRTSLYYTNGIIDSVITRGISQSGQNTITKTYYNQQGLKDSLITSDRLIVAYKHHFRKPSTN